MSESRASRSEWIVAIVSGLLVLAVLGYMLFAALSGPVGPPLLSVRTDSVVQTGDGYLVLFTARNDGAETAATVGIVGVVKTDTVLEERRTTLDYVPVGAERNGGLMFGVDPRTGTLELRASGYSAP